VIVASGAGNAVAMGVGGVVAVLVISAVFYVIGRGEDRDRATLDAPPAPPVADPAPPEPRPDRRLPARAKRRRRP
jgi:hypothetical protein